VADTTWGVRVQTVTETVLTWRKRRKLRKKEKQRRKSAVRDWAEAIGSAVLIVLLINQYVLQAYMIPSPSMVPTLEVRDRIFVNKLVYGPELIPGLAKIGGFRQPRRGEVIIFENPSYISRGPALDVLQRVIYMVTLSLVDIDRDENGNPKHHFLIKRAIGMPGDRIRFDQGNTRILRRGEGAWVEEPVVKKDIGIEYPTVRLFAPAKYDSYRKLGVGLALREARLPLGKDATDNVSGGTDGYFVDTWKYRAQYEIDPSNALYRGNWRRLDRGFVIGADELLPLGDNRDNSNDGRYFGPVKLKKVLGRGLLKYWPLARIGGIG
jgi:signal peptidase I